jgi:hypothetical protein
MNSATVSANGSWPALLASAVSSPLRVDTSVATDTASRSRAPVWASSWGSTSM